MLIDLFSFLQQLAFLQGVGGLVLLIIGLLLIGGGLDGRLTLLAVATVWFAMSMLLLDVVPAVQAFTRIITGVTITLLLLRVLWLDENLRWFSWRRLSYVAVLMGLALLVTQFVESYLPDSLLLYIATVLTITVGIISIVSVTNRVLVGIGLLLILLFLDVVTAVFYPSEPLTIIMATLQIVTAFTTTWLITNHVTIPSGQRRKRRQQQPSESASQPLSPQPLPLSASQALSPQPLPQSDSQPVPSQPLPQSDPQPLSPQPSLQSDPQPLPLQPLQTTSTTSRRKRRRKRRKRRKQPSEPDSQPLPPQPLQSEPPQLPLQPLQSSRRRRRRRRRRPRQRLF